MNSLNVTTETLLRELSYIKDKKEADVEGDIIGTSEAVSTLAIIYESARNAVEFSAEHLIRQAAIARILKRRLFLNQPSKRLSLHLVKELLWARYLKEGSVSTKKVKEIEAIIEKYRFVIKATRKNKKEKRSDFIEWLINVVSCEIEEMIIFDPTQQVLVNYVYESLLKRIEFGEEDLETRSIQVYIAVERGFAQNNDTLISYRLLKTIFPDWVKGRVVLDDEVSEKLYKAYSEIKKQLNYPLKQDLKKTVIKMSPPFNLIRELIEEYGDDLEKVLANSDIFQEEAIKTLEDLYSETQEKLNRASIRSIVYIFLTKMVFGLLIELPYDIFMDAINYTALAINAFFPPITLFLLNIGAKIPDKKNTAKLLRVTRRYLFDDSKPEAIKIEKEKRVASFENFFIAVYILTYILIFGGIIWVLNLLDFNIVSQIIFLFFLTIVSFFAYRIRGIAKDFHLQEEGKEGFFSSFVDFIFLPIIRVGQWLSAQIASFNVLSLILDFVIEAPLKSFLGVIEDWIHFIRTKKEEIVT